MIKVTRYDNSILYINPDLIEVIEETPDTIITLITGRKIPVKEKANHIIDQMIEYYNKANIKNVRLQISKDLL